MLREGTEDYWVKCCACEFVSVDYVPIDLQDLELLFICPMCFRISLLRKSNERPRVRRTEGVSLPANVIKEIVAETRKIDTHIKSRWALRN